MLIVFGCLLATLLATGLAQAGSIEPRNATLVADEEGYSLAADFAIALGPRLEDAVTRGVPLHFRFEFNLTRKRWYWMEEHIAGRVLNYKLGFQALTRQYRLTLGNLHHNYGTLEEALQALGHIASLHVVDKHVLKPGEAYQAAVRLSLDHNELPKPLQVDALADREWRVETSPLRWVFVPTEDK